MLMYHLDAKRHGVVGAADVPRLPIDKDLTGVRRQQSEQNVHQRAFARAVLAQ